MSEKIYLQAGDTVELLELPTGSSSQHYKLTIGNKYSVKGIFGCCVQTNTDDNDTGIYHRDRVRVVSKAATAAIEPN